MSIWLPGITMGVGRGEEVEAELERQKEYLAALEKLVVEEKRKLSNDTIEECARVLDEMQEEPNNSSSFNFACRLGAAAIRALKDKP